MEIKENDTPLVQKKDRIDKTYDGILTLGCWCQVGSMSWKYSHKAIYTPLDNIGIKQWQLLMDMLESRFSDIWDLENITIGKPGEYFSLRYREKRQMYKVYDNKYDLVTSHYFHEEENTPEELLTYADFKEKRDVLAEIFLRQCELYENILFTCKIMSHPIAPTIIHRNDIKRLCDVLDVLRKGQPYDLKISVPSYLYDEVIHWVKEDGLEQVQLYPWQIVWNDVNEQDEEWFWMYGNAKLSTNYLERLNEEIIGIQDPNSQHLEYLRG